MKTSISILTTHKTEAIASIKFYPESENEIRLLGRAIYAEYQDGEKDLIESHISSAIHSLKKGYQFLDLVSSMNNKGELIVKLTKL